ncbi:MAG TPA: peptide deformylase [Bryobacteraceae bacterium]|jgi:peptide deformylase
MIHKIVKYGDPVLEREADLVENFGTAELRQFVEDMFESMYSAKGVGLAAPQIGVGKKITVIDISGGVKNEEGVPPSERIVLINPKIVSKEGKQVGEEGCLSIPGFREQVRRAKRVTVRAQNVEGEWFERSGEDLLARAMQHEIDHLNGILFISHISSLKREIIKNKIKKLAKAGEWE